MHWHPRRLIINIRQWCTNTRWSKEATMKNVIFLSEQEFTGWIKNGKWRIEHFISKDLFLKGQFSITEINPRIIYRDFTYLKPLFVEVETNEKEDWVSLIDITACFCQQQYFAQQQELVHEHFGTSSPICIERLPLEVEEAIKQWMIDSEFSDAKVGGCQITEMLFTPLYNPIELKQWIKLKQDGLGANSTQSPLCHILQYQREHQKKGILGAIMDLGLSLKPLNEDEQIEIIKDILRPIVTDFSKSGSEILSDSEILNKVRQEICKNDKLTTSWKALVCPFILYFAMKVDGAISSTTINIDVCQQFIKQWTTYGFVYEIREACWLLGFRAHASNFSRQYLKWKFQRKESLLNKEACFQEADHTISSLSDQNVSTENVQTLNSSTNTENLPINEQVIPLAATTPSTSSDKQILPKDLPSENNAVNPENINNTKQDAITASNDREGNNQSVNPTTDSVQTIFPILDDKQDSNTTQSDEQSASTVASPKKNKKSLNTSNEKNKRKKIPLKN